MPKVPNVQDISYMKLLNQIRQDIKNTHVNIERQKVLACWKMGKAIDNYIAKVEPHLKVSHIPSQLATDLNISSRVIRACIQFHRTYPKLDSSLPISWSHYRYLISIKSAKERTSWERRIVKENLSSDAFLGLLSYSRIQKTQRSDNKNTLKGERGLLYHYRLVSVDYINDASGGIMVDLGFKLRMHPPTCKCELSNKRIVRIDKINGEYSLKVTDELIKSVYIYKAIVERVVDGDTILANIDCGFGVWSKQYLRLKGIDAPEIDSVSGRQSKRFVENELLKCPFVIVKTHKSDKYDRYLSDVYYSSRISDINKVAAKGHYLNQALIDNGFADIWKG